MPPPSWDEEKGGDENQEGVPLLSECFGGQEAVPLLAEQDIDIVECGGQDIVQFSSAMYYASESDDAVKIEVVRLGSMVGRLSVTCTTKDASGTVANGDYAFYSHQLVFEDGEHVKNIEVNVFDSTEGLWSPTLEFRLCLSEPRNCKMGQFLHNAGAAIFNDDPFPSDEVEEEVAQGQEGIQNIPDWHLFVEYCKLNFNSAGVKWPTILVLVMDQLMNVLLFISLWVGVYLVDTVMDQNHYEPRWSSTSHHMLGKTRYETAVIVATWFVVPSIVGWVWSYTKARLDIQGKSRTFLQKSLLQANLDYAGEARTQVTAPEICTAVAGNAREVASGYVALLEIAAVFGKVATIGIFIKIFQPNPLAMYGGFSLILAVLILVCVCSQQIEVAQLNADDKEGMIEVMVDEATRKYQLVHAYDKRGAMKDMFAQATQTFSDATVPVVVAGTHTKYLAKFLTASFVFLYVVVKAPAVFNKELSLGMFLATIGIFTSDVAGLADDLNSHFRSIFGAFLPLKEVTFWLNLPSDLPLCKKTSLERRTRTQDERAAILADPEASVSIGGDKCKTDLIRIAVEDLSFEYTPGVPLLTNVNLSLQQGQMLAVTGPHKSGKTAFMQLLSHGVWPSSGSIVAPSHMRILQVARDPMFLRATMLANLCLGLPSHEPVDLERIFDILRLCGVPEAVDMVQQEADAENENPLRKGHACFMNLGIHFDESPEGLTAILSLTHSQRNRLHIARALIANPNIMVIERCLDGLHEKEALLLLQVLRSHITNRGIGEPEDSFSRRRPRNVFFSTENAKLAAQADSILDMDPKSKSIVEVKPPSKTIGTTSESDMQPHKFV